MSRPDSNADSPTSPVQTRNDDGILVVTIANPPVNALNAAVRQGLLAAIEQAQVDPAIAAVVITGSDKSFIAGADIRELGTPPQLPLLPTVCNAIEACGKPVAVAIEGAALGGGLEVAMAAHLRLASRASKLGLPEVQLGLLPGSGGTQRAPRLIGVPAALDLMLGGKPFDAGQALASGLVDGLAEPGTVLRETLARVRAQLAQAGVPRRTGMLWNGRPAAASERAAIAAARADAAKKSPQLASPHLIVAAVEAGLDLPFDTALAFERTLFTRCLASPQHAGLRHAFLAERAAGKPPASSASAAASTAPGIARALQRLGVVGGGMMGVGIAVAMLDAGFEVAMVERDAAAAAQGRGRVEGILAGMLAKGRITAAQQDATLGRFSAGADYAALREADLVVEAVFEDFDAKQQVFAQLDRVCKPGAVLATNTSYLDIDKLAAGTSRPQDVIGLHFFSPAHIMKLLEIVVPAATGADVVATAFALGKRLGKVAVWAGVCDGFIGNRILARYREAADHMLEDGASPYQIDRAVRGFGFPMGQFEVSDLAGGDIGWAARKRRAPLRDPRARYVRIGDRLCEQGWFGQKTGRGWYRYTPGSRVGAEDADVLAIVDDARRVAGVQPRAFTDDEIVRRYMAAMINEGANVLEEGIAQKPSDVDVTFLHGYGFPRFRGGPMKHADQVGVRQVLADIQEFARQDPIFWRPSPLLARLAESGRDFDSLNT